MTQIPLLKGVVSTEAADFSLSYPVNLEPVPVESGISKGYLQSMSGVAPWATGPGPIRGAIVWNGLYHAVMGAKLVSVSSAGVVSILGDVGGTGPVAMDYGFGRLAIQSGTNLYYWDGTALTQVTDPDLGQCFDVVWMAGYYVSTDGTSIISTQLSDPTQVDPLKYGSAESDPDMVTGLIRVRNELAVTGQNTIEFFTNVGGSGFPFQASEGATIPIGCVGPRAKCLFGQTFAFCGGGRNHGIGIWLAGAGNAQKLSTRAVDDALAEVTDLALIILESRSSRDEERLLVHLPDRTMIYYANASQAAGEPVWGGARSGVMMNAAYRLRFATFCYGKWIVGDTDSGALGVLDDGLSSHFGDETGWRFDTMLLYNGGRGGIVHDLELIGLPGRGGDGSAFLSFTEDGETWSMEKPARLPLNRRGRVQFSPHKRFRNLLGMRFRGSGSQLAGWAALEARIEGLK